MLVLRLRKKHEQDRLTKEYFERVRNLRPPVHTADQAWQTAAVRLTELLDEEGKTFQVDEENQRVCQLLAWYFGNDERFETDVWESEKPRSLRKGLLLYGNIGCGKTRLMEAFNANTRQSYLMVSCRRVVDDFTSQGTSIIDRLSGLVSVGQPHRYYDQRQLGICFDDLGTESEGAHFKSTRNVLAEILQNRYEKPEVRFMTHVTTNLTPAELKQAYGPRVHDRMRDMFNVISFPKDAQSRRG